MMPALLAAMGDPPAKKPPSAFVSDTLAPLVGGPFEVVYGPDRDQDRRRELRGRGGIRAGRTNEAGDSVFVFTGSGVPDRDHTLRHEAGHVFTRRMVEPRQLAPELVLDLLQARERFKPRSAQEKYYATNDHEYIAETFARALDHVRHGRTDDDEAEKAWPGLKSAAAWMRTRKPFAKEME